MKRRLKTIKSINLFDDLIGVVARQIFPKTRVNHLNLITRRLKGCLGGKGGPICDQASLDVLAETYTFLPGLGKNVLLTRMKQKRVFFKKCLFFIVLSFYFQK